MMSNFSFTVEIAGIAIRFEAPRTMEIPPELRPFLTEKTQVQEVYQIEFIHSPICFSTPPSYTSNGLEIHSCDGATYRGFLHLKAADGCVPQCCLRSNGHHTLYIPAIDWGRYERNCTLSVLLGPEALFLRHNGFILHSSVVRYEGQALLFCGASGAGKSTQAQLWEKYRQGEILNGDRCVIMKRGDRFYGCGSPYCGSSGIYRKEDAPIRAIILPVKAAENRVERMKPEEALRKLYRETLVNLWDVNFVNQLLDLLQELVLRVPVYSLYCRPDEQATELTLQAVFGGS
jgi:hypothetical protein